MEMKITVYTIQVRGDSGHVDYRLVSVNFDEILEFAKWHLECMVDDSEIEYELIKLEGGCFCDGDGWSIELNDDKIYIGNQKLRDKNIRNVDVYIPTPTVKSEKPQYKLLTVKSEKPQYKLLTVEE
jgi:hypothetical protein